MDVITRSQVLTTATGPKGIVNAHLSGVARQVIKPVPHYSPLISDGVMTAVWMPDNMNIYLHDLKIVL